MIYMDKQEELQFFLESLDSYEDNEEILALLERLHKLGIRDSEVLKYLKENNKRYIIETVKKNMSILDNYKNNHYLFQKLINLSKSQPRNKTSILNTMDQINDNNISDDEILDVIFTDFDENIHYDFISSLVSVRESKLAEIEAERSFQLLEEEQRERDRENNFKNKDESGSFIKEFFLEILPVIIIVIFIISYGLKSCSNSLTYYSDDYEETYYRGR